MIALLIVHFSENVFRNHNKSTPPPPSKWDESFKNVDIQCLIRTIHTTFQKGMDKIALENARNQKLEKVILSQYLLYVKHITQYLFLEKE
jgi:hypothetical protein